MCHRNLVSPALAACIALLATALATPAAFGDDGRPWTAPHRYRVRLSIDVRGKSRSNSPVSANIDFQKALALHKSTELFDEHSLEVVVCDASGRPRIFDASRPPGERHLLPWRTQRYYGATTTTLSFVLPDQTCTTCLVYFDTQASGLGKPRRYPGLVGDGDCFSEGFHQREINASHFDQFCDFDGDGDLDLFKGGVEPYVYCYENVGANRFVDRGRLTSGGEHFVLPRSKANRSWVTVAFHDWDGDGDQDFFPSFGDGPDAGTIIFYRNTTREHAGQLTFTRVGPLRTLSGTPLAGGQQAGGLFPTITFVRDWDGDGDGRTDLLVGSNDHCYLYRNLGPDEHGEPRLADAVTIQADGKDIVLVNPRFDCADIDSDGDLDLFAGTDTGPAYWFENIGTRAKPLFKQGVIVAFGGKYLIADAYTGVKVADFDGDGLLDVVAGRFWQRTDLADPRQPRDFGGFFRNVGTRTRPRFERRTQGAPFTEQFQNCDAIRQNSVRATDWDRDGRLDLLAGDTDGFIWFFRNRGANHFPLFSTPEKLLADGKPLSLASSGGHARLDICDWNNDGQADLLVADGSGALWIFLNKGNSALASPQRMLAEGKPIQHGSRASVLVCDWNNDGLKDIIMAEEKGYWFHRNVGTRGNSLLEAARPITFNSRPVTYIRPNLGSFVDWDGDGVKDFIGCNFENSIRLYRNLAPALPGQEPRFASPEGQVILQGSSPQMISGADVIDWNHDGDLDLLTGQGHAASSLRFYERDFLEDEIRGTHPLASIIAIEPAPPR